MIGDDLPISVPEQDQAIGAGGVYPEHRFRAIHGDVLAPQPPAGKHPGVLEDPQRDDRPDPDPQDQQPQRLLGGGPEQGWRLLRGLWSKQPETT